MSHMQAFWKALKYSTYIFVLLKLNSVIVPQSSKKFIDMHKLTQRCAHINSVCTTQPRSAPLTFPFPLKFFLFLIFCFLTQRKRRSMGGRYNSLWLGGKWRYEFAASEEQIQLSQIGRASCRERV